MVPRLIKVFGSGFWLSTLAGCTVLGAGIGSGFSSAPEEFDASFVGPGLIGTRIKVVDVDGNTHQGLVSDVQRDWFVLLTPNGYRFGSGTPDTISVQSVDTFLVGGVSGAKRGMFVGLLVDASVVAYVLYAYAVAGSSISE